MGQGKNERILQKVLEARKPIRFSDLERLMLEIGFVRRSIEGSHRIYVHPKARRPLSLQPKGNEAKPYQIRQLRDMIVEFRLLED